MADCPNAIRNPNYKFLICKDMIDENTNINDKKEAIKAYCAYQRHCNCAMRVINSNGAAECYQRRLKVKEEQAD